MHDRQLGGEALVLQIGVERFELEGRDHALVADGARGQRHEVRTGLAAGALAQAVGQAVQRDARHGRAVGGACGDEELLEHRARLEGESAEIVRRRGDLAPAEHDQTLLVGDLLDRRLLTRARLGVRGKEGQAGGVLAHRREREGDDVAEEDVGHLREDPGTVAGAGVRPDRTAVLEVPERGQREVHDVVSGLAPQCRDHGEAAGVLLERGVVHALTRGEAAGQG